MSTSPYRSVWVIRAPLVVAAFFIMLMKNVPLASATTQNGTMSLDASCNTTNNTNRSSSHKKNCQQHGSGDEDALSPSFIYFVVGIGAVVLLVLGVIGGVKCMRCIKKGKEERRVLTILRNEASVAEAATKRLQSSRDDDGNDDDKYIVVRDETIVSNCPHSSPETPTATCVICLSRPAHVAMVPCGHVTMCQDCVDELGVERIPENCMTCREEVSAILVVDELSIQTSDDYAPPPVCHICGLRRVRVAVQPCGHVPYCETCFKAYHFSECVLCGEPIKDSLTLFW